MLALTRLEVPAPFELWLADLTVEPDAETMSGLCSAERERASRFVFERDRRRYLSAHGVLRHLLAARTGIPVTHLRFSKGAFGKPSLMGEPGCAFNLSHSQDVAAVVLCEDGDVGVDVEVLRDVPDAMTMALAHFTDAERVALSGEESQALDEAFLLTWTRKEACLKALGTGLSVSPQSFEAGANAERREALIPTATGCETVSVQSLHHGNELVVSWARVV